MLPHFRFLEQYASKGVANGDRLLPPRKKTVPKEKSFAYSHGWILWLVNRIIVISNDYSIYLCALETVYRLAKATLEALWCGIRLRVTHPFAMSKLSFRARALDATKPLPIYHADDLPDLSDFSTINRTVPQMPTGMEKEEESVSSLHYAL